MYLLFVESITQARFIMEEDSGSDIEMGSDSDSDADQEERVEPEEQNENLQRPWIIVDAEDYQVPNR